MADLDERKAHFAELMSARPPWPRMQGNTQTVFSLRTMLTYLYMHTHLHLTTQTNTCKNTFKHNVDLI